MVEIKTGTGPIDCLRRSRTVSNRFQKRRFVQGQIVVHKLAKIGVTGGGRLSFLFLRDPTCRPLHREPKFFHHLAVEWRISGRKQPAIVVDGRWFVWLVHCQRDRMECREFLAKFARVRETVARVSTRNFRKQMRTKIPTVRAFTPRIATISLSCFLFTETRETGNAVSNKLLIDSKAGVSATSSQRGSNARFSARS